MEKHFSSLQGSTLFADIAEEDIQKLYGCLGAQEKSYPCESFIFHEGDEVKLVYFVLEGSFHIINEDFWGNRAIIETLNKNTLFGEAYVFSGRKQHLVSVIAAEDSTILAIEPRHLFDCCAQKCLCHEQLIKNLLCIVSEKIVRLTEKTGHIMQRTTHEKLLSYLSKCAQIEKSSSFDIPYSRQQLADYLCVDRSALSHELSKLQKCGMIRYSKNHFELLENDNELL